jgi:hypothetical protein
MEAKLPTKSPPESSPAPARRAGFPYATWGPGTALIGLFVALSAQSVFSGAVVAIDGTEGDGDPSTAASIVLQGIFAIGLIAVAVVIASMGRIPWREALRHLGLRRFQRSAWLYMAASVGVYLVFAALYVALVGEPEQEDIAEDFGPVGIQIVLVVLAAGFAEEVAFRGLLFGGLRTRMPGWAAALISAAIFGALHAFTGISAVPVLIGFGFVLALLYERTGSIVPGIVLHMLNNALALAAQ